MAGHRARIRGGMQNLTSHFEQSLQELNVKQKGTAGRSASVHNVLLEDDEDALAKTFILRKASLTQEQWEDFLSPDKTSQEGDLDRTSSSANLLGRKSGASLTRNSKAAGSSSGTGAVLRRKSSSFDIESAERDVASNRMATSIFFLPLMTPWNPFYTVWTQLVLGLDLSYTAFLVPLLVGFKVSDIDWGYGCIIDFTAGLLFTIEIFVNFQTGFIGKNNGRRRLIMDGKAVAWYYITHGHFFVDSLTSAVWVAQCIFIGLYHSGTKSIDGTATQVYQAIRILRLIRFTSLLRRLYATATAASQSIVPGLQLSHAYMNFFNLIFGGVVLANFLGCVWNFTAISEGFEGTWINLYGPFVRTYGSADSQSNGELLPQEAAAIPGTHRYLVGIYFTLVTIGTVGYGDVLPQTVGETFIAMFIICMGLVFFGIILGSIAEALQRLSKDAKAAVLFRNRMESVDKWMSYRGLPRPLRSRIGNYYAEDWLVGADASEEVIVMTELPYGLRKDISLCINKPVFKKLNMFADFPDKVLGAITATMQPLQLPAGFELCEEEDHADCFWVLHDGEVASTSLTNQEANMTLKAPALVGQVAILQEQDDQYLVRGSTYRTHTSCLLWEVPLRDVLPILRANPQLYELASQQALPNHYFDYLTINPAATFLAEDAQEMGFKTNTNSVNYKELESEKTIASQNGSQGSMGRPSGKSLNPSAGSQNMTRSEFKRSELKRAKSGRF